MAFPLSYILLSTACTHTLWMPWLSMLALGCRLVGQTPIYDQLRSERINADVPPSHIHSHRPADPGRHRLDAEAPNAAAVVVRPVRSRKGRLGRSPSAGADLPGSSAGR